MTRGKLWRTSESGHWPPARRHEVEQVDWDDVQGPVLSGYPLARYAAYIPWRFISPEDSTERLQDSKEWLRALAERLMRADQADRSAGDEPKRPTSLKSMKV